MIGIGTMTTFNKSKMKPSLTWIPWQRYALFLNMDDRQTVFLGRFRLKKSATREAVRLSVYAGYEPEVIDTKEESQ